MTGVRGVLVLVVLASLTTAGRAEVLKETSAFKSGGKEIRVERYEPKEVGPHPVILILNGSNGVEVHAKHYRDFAESLAEKGYVALIPYYFDRTGTTYADRKEIDANYLHWLATINDGLSYAAGLPKVDRKKMGLVGFSLGAYLSLSVTAVKGSQQIAAVAEYAGGLVELPFANLGKMPPTLILHGEDDDIVSVKEAHTLEEALKKNKVPYEIKIYKNQKHVFTGEDARDASDRVGQFFDKHVKNVKAEKK